MEEKILITDTEYLKQIEVIAVYTSRLGLDRPLPD
jgi:hypothetical protein